MKLVDRHILRELAGPFAFGVAAFSSVFFAGSYLLKLTNMLMNGAPLFTVLKIVLLYLPAIVVYTLPMATLLAVLLGIGRLSGDSEVVALFASGISIYRIVIPVVALGIVVSAGAIVLNEVVAPRANLQNQEIQAMVLKDKSVSDRPFTVKDEGTNSQITVKGGMDVDKGLLKDVTIVKYPENAIEPSEANRPSMIIYAARAQWAGMNDKSKRYVWWLYDGFAQQIGTNSPAYAGFNETHTQPLEIKKTPEQFALYQKDPEQMSFSEMSALVQQLKSNPDRPTDEIRKMEVKRWNKLALPISSLVFAMLAAPLAIRPQRNASSVGLGLSIFLILIYWIIWHYTSVLAGDGNLTPVVGAFSADVLGIIFAIILLKRAAK